MAANSKTTTLKLLLLGSPSTGKTALLRRYVDDVYSEDTASTVGVEFSAKVVTLDGEKVKLALWDTAGQERYATVTRSYMRGAVGALLVYDVTNRSTFEAVPKWLHDLRQLAGPDVVVMLVGNKADLCSGNSSSSTSSEGEDSRREVPHTKASVYAQENGLMHMETSAATGDFVPEAFLRVARTVLQRQRNGGAAGIGGGGGNGAASASSGQKGRLLDVDDEEGNSAHEAANNGMSPTRMRLQEQQQQNSGDEATSGGRCSRC